MVACLVEAFYPLGIADEHQKLRTHWDRHYRMRKYYTVYHLVHYRNELTTTFEVIRMDPYILWVLLDTENLSQLGHNVYVA